MKSTSISSRFRVIDDGVYLKSTTPRRIVLGVLNHQVRAFNAKCVGFVIMPDHIHALIWLPEPGQLSRLMHGWKRMSSFKIRKWFKENPVAYFELPAAHAAYYFDSLDLGDKFWQPKYYSFSIYSNRKLCEKLQYIHLNPVRAGLAERAVDWLWSSARYYEWRQTVGVQVEWIECTD